MFFWVLFAVFLFLFLVWIFCGWLFFCCFGLVCIFGNWVFLGGRQGFGSCFFVVVLGFGVFLGGVVGFVLLVLVFAFLFVDTSKKL